MNLHLLSAPIFERHTAFNIFYLRIKVLDSAFPLFWRTYESSFVILTNI